MKSKIKLNIIFPLVTTVFSIVWIYLGIREYGLWDAASTSPKDGMFPTIIAIVLLVVSILNIFGSTKEEAVTFDRKTLYLIAALALIYFATEYIGLVTALMMFYVLWLKFYAKVNWKTILIASAAMFVLMYFGFEVGLKIQFPKGILLQGLH